MYVLAFVRMLGVQEALRSAEWIMYDNQNIITIKPKREYVMKYNILVLLLLLVPQLKATTFTVINTNDSGAGSLRQAITDANLDMSPPTIIDFNIPGAGPHTIVPTTFFLIAARSMVYPPFTQTITLDATTQPGYSIGNQQIIIDYSTTSAALHSGNGLTILGADNCVIKGLSFNSYVGLISGRGISIQNTLTHGVDGTHISQCRGGSYLMFGNTRAIVADGSASAVFPITNTVIGGPNPEDGNVLSGNSIAGLFLQFNVLNSLVQNNKIGCDKTGTTAVGNAYGIAMIGDTNFPVNGTVIKDNVIAGNSTYGIIIQSNANENIIQNNKIGTEITGASALGHAAVGVLMVNAPGNTCEGNLIGGTGLNEGNVISGNDGGGVGVGIYMSDNINTSTIEGNFIGTDITGTAAIPNLYGIYIQGGLSMFSGADITTTITAAEPYGVALPTLSGTPCVDNVIGGSAAGAGNVISFNTIDGIYLFSNVVDTIIQGNFIGTDLTGLVDQGNGGSGIVIQGVDGGPVTGTLIGGTTTSAKNIIANNDAFGVSFLGDPATPDILNAIIGNSIFNNVGKGINLTNNANDLQQGPTITSVTTCCNDTNFAVVGVAPVLPAASNFRLEFFNNPSNTAPNTQGKQLIAVIPSIGSGENFSLSAISPTPITPGSFLTATATNLNNGGNPGNTSEFTLDFSISAAAECIDATLTTNVDQVDVGGSATLTVTITSGVGPFDIDWSDGFTQTGVVSSADHIVSPDMTTTYSALITDSNGCTFETNDVTIVVVSGQLSPISEAIIKKYCN